MVVKCHFNGAAKKCKTIPVTAKMTRQNAGKPPRSQYRQMMASTTPEENAQNFLRTLRARRAKILMNMKSSIFPLAPADADADGGGAALQEQEEGL